MIELRPEDIEGLLEELEAEYGTESSQARQYLDKAYALDEDFDFGKALEACDTAIQLDPTLADAHRLRGAILEELNRQQEAVQAYREALRHDPCSESVKWNLQMAETELYAEKAGWDEAT
ncbi:MAG: tetratricopeptide repeat protein [Anaerolineae bacterium]|jgi:Flp pilus assembly protein TadD